jgi:xanthine dehydrogenase small subunit
MKTRHKGLVYVNGVRQTIEPGEHFMMVADWLRKEKHLVGTKVVCAEGDCGACTIMKVGCSSGKSEKNSMRAVNSCIAIVGQLDGSSIVTIEGIAADGAPSPVQKAMVECHASQCGYCTPGFVMALSALNETQPTRDVSDKKILNSLTGNLCRCTGYKPIIDAATAAGISKEHKVGPRYASKKLLLDLRKSSKTPLLATSNNRLFIAPTSLRSAAEYKQKYKQNLTILGAGTDLGVMYNKGKGTIDKAMSLHLIDSLFEIKEASGRIVVGCQVDLTRVREFCKTRAPEFSRLLDIFASPQIKNAATLIGNIANGSPIGDSMPYLLVANASVHAVQLKNGKLSKRVIPLDKFYLEYKKNALKPEEIISHVSFDKESKEKILKSTSKQSLLKGPRDVRRVYKVSARKDLDISSVSLAMHMTAIPKSDDQVQINEISIALGGVAAVPLMSKSTGSFLKGKIITLDLLNSASDLLLHEIKPLSDLRGTSTYRKVLVRNLFKKFFEEFANPRSSTKS